MKAQHNPINLYSRIDNHLLLNSSFIKNLGLMHGKMGLSIFFFQIGRTRRNKIYHNYAEELIDEIYQEIDETISPYYENGLAGIGWGLDYLVRNGFVDVDTNNILADIDEKVSKEILFNTPVEIGFLNGLIGLGAYQLMRTKNELPGNMKTSRFGKEQSLVYLISELDRATQEIEQIIIEPKFSSKKEILRAQNSNTGMIKSDNLLNHDLREDTQIKIRSNEVVFFDITWDYPILFLFLADTFKQDIQNSNIKEIILRCIKPLENLSYLPQCVGNRLMLAYAILNLLFTIKNSKNKKSLSEIDFKQKLNHLNDVVQKLFWGISRESILTELSSVSPTIRHGIPGIIWIYKKLFILTNDPSYNIEAIKLSTSKSFFKDLEKWFNINLENKENQHFFGLLSGLSGVKLIVNA